MQWSKKTYVTARKVREAGVFSAYAEMHVAQAITSDGIIIAEVSRHSACGADMALNLRMKEIEAGNAELIAQLEREWISTDQLLASRGVRRNA